MKEGNIFYLFFILFLLVSSFFLGSSARAEEIPVGTLLYRTSGGGQMYGATTDKIVDGNTINPGHVAIYAGDGKILEAVNKGVVLNDLKNFIYTNKGEKFIGAKIPSNYNFSYKEKLDQIIQFLAKQGFAYDVGLSTQKGPGGGEWICTGVTEKIYESLGFDGGQFEDMSKLEYNPANYFIDITPDGYEQDALYNEEFGDHFSTRQEYSKISKRRLLAEKGLIYNGMGRIHEGGNYFFFPYTQFLQPGLKTVEVDIEQISSNFNEEEVRGKALILLAVRQGIKNNTNNFKEQTTLVIKNKAIAVKNKAVEVKDAVVKVVAKTNNKIKNGASNLWALAKNIFSKDDRVLVREDEGSVLSASDDDDEEVVAVPEPEPTEESITIASSQTQEPSVANKEEAEGGNTESELLEEAIDEELIKEDLVLTEEEKQVETGDTSDQQLGTSDKEQVIDDSEEVEQGQELIGPPQVIHPFNPHGSSEEELDSSDAVLTEVSLEDVSVEIEEDTATSTSDTSTSTEDTIATTTETSTSTEDVATSTPEVATSTPLLIKPVVISEFTTRGPGGARDEFVELYNFSTSSLDISAWRLMRKAETGESWINKTGDGLVDASIPGLGFYLLTSEQYSLDVVPDYRHTASFGFADGGGHILLVDEMGNEIDKVAYGAEAVDPETAPIVFDLSEGKSAERKAYATSTSEDMQAGGAHHWSGNAFDSNDNSADFVAIDNPNPQNTSSLSEPVEVDNIIPGAINDLSFASSSLTENSVSLNWTVPANASLATSSYYDIRYEEIGRNDPTEIDWDNTYFQETYTPSSTSATEQSLLISGLKSNSSYVFAIKVFNGYNWSEISNQVATTTIADEFDPWGDFYNYAENEDAPFMEDFVAMSSDLECSYTSDLVGSEEIFAQTFVPATSAYSTSSKVLSSLALMMKPIVASNYSIDAVRLCSGEMVSATGTNSVADWDCDNPGQELIADIVSSEITFDSYLGNYQWRNFSTGEDHQLEWESEQDNHFVMIKGKNLSFCHAGPESDAYSEGRAVSQDSNISDFIFAIFQALFLF